MACCSRNNCINLWVGERNVRVRVGRLVSLMGRRQEQAKPNRRSIRWSGYDYSQPGAYFVTICTHNRECLFGHIVGAQMVLNDAGRMVQTVWDRLPNHYSHVELDSWTIMPNHVHGIIILTVGAGFKPAPGSSGKPEFNLLPVDETGLKPNQRAGYKPAPTVRHGLPEIVRGFKTFSSRRINKSRGTVGTPVWQKNYYEHVIRNDRELNRIREYIISNPARWATDKENPNVSVRCLTEHTDE